MQCTAVVNEAWLRLAQAQDAGWTNRTHFFAYVSRLMRTILIDYARAKRSAKRGGGEMPFSLADSDAISNPPEVEVLELNAALEELEQLDPMQGRIVELRYFSGLSIPETAEALGTSESTVKREWTVAKTWIRRRLAGGEERHAGRGLEARQRTVLRRAGTPFIRAGAILRHTIRSNRGDRGSTIAAG
jgi:RNA polymerase sigma factor (TIGR02999 family)